MRNGKGRLVVITGGAGGIGYALAQRFVAAGDRVVLSDLDGVALAEVKVELGPSVVCVQQMDISNRKSVFEFANKVVTEFGPPDVLVNNAGIGHNGELLGTSIACWNRLLEVNLLGAIHHVDAFAHHMKGRKGSVIANVSSGQSFFRLPTWGAYAAVKAALGVYSEVLHHELRPRGIAVCTVYPFMVNTGFYREVEGGSLGTRISMKLLPWYSMSAASVANHIHRAIDGRRRLELVTPINRAAAVAAAMPVIPALIGWGANWFLGSRGEHREEEEHAA
jgi:NAD(P)-dependent dehydrogenase (short-subunit alcohol dehydrogenase family)